MKTMNQIVGENLKKTRELSGFTQEQVAKSIGVERSAYSNYESGVREVPFHLVEADNEILATAFRISDVEEGDLKEIAHFKDLVKSYLKMERIGNGSK